MVRTKADGAVRVASGGKAPKKGGGGYHNPSPSPTEKLGKDNLPVNRYCPRETPSWQKTITNFFEKGASSSKPKPQPEVNDVQLKPVAPSAPSKRKSSELDDQEMDVTENVSRQKKLKSVSEDNGSGDGMEMEI